MHTTPIILHSNLVQHEIRRGLKADATADAAALRPIHAKRVYVRLRPSRDGRRRPSMDVDVDVRRRAWFGHAFHFAWIVIRSRHLKEIFLFIVYSDCMWLLRYDM